MEVNRYPPVWFRCHFFCGSIRFIFVVLVSSHWLDVCGIGCFNGAQVPEPFNRDFERSLLFRASPTSESNRIFRTKPF